MLLGQNSAKPFFTWYKQLENTGSGNSRRYSFSKPSQNKNCYSKFKIKVKNCKNTRNATATQFRTKKKK